MRLNLEQTTIVLLKCISYSENLYDLEASLKFIDNLISPHHFPDEGYKRLDAIGKLLNAYARKHDELVAKEDETKIDLSVFTLDPQ
jgi:hypothetical protein